MILLYFMFFTITISILVIYWIFNNQQIKALKEFPQSPNSFFTGHSLQIKDTTKILNVITEFLNYGSVIRINIGPSFAPFFIVLATNDYKFTEYLLSSNEILTKTENYYYLEPWLGLGLLISDGNKWKQHRKIITPAFHFEILKQFVGAFESVGNILIDKLKEYGNSSSLDIYPLVTLCTLDIICETAMGTKINAQKGENLEYVNYVRDICRIVIGRTLTPIKIFRYSFMLTKDFYTQNWLIKKLHNFTLNVINRKREELKNQKGDDSKISKKVAFLDLLLKYSEDGKRISYEEIREEVDTFMFEGHDTTASGICFTLYCLANYPDIQRQVLQEQKELFGEEKNPFVSYQDLQNMKYLEMVIKESLRLYPSVPVIGRYTKKDIQFNDRKIPKHTNIVISIFNMHRNPKYFPEPEKFNPERFRNFNNSHLYSYIPFSAGPRNCIGQKFAMLEMKSIISKIIRNFELSQAKPEHNLVLSVETVLKSVNGIKVGIKKRFQ